LQIMQQINRSLHLLKLKVSLTLSVFRGKRHDPELAVTLAHVTARYRRRIPSLGRDHMLQLAIHYTPSSRLTQPLLLLAIGLAGIVLSLSLGIAPADGV
jgi:hypothetical protein